MSKKETRYIWFLFAALFALLLVRWFCYGFSYFPQLDDVIQYHNYRSFFGSLKNCIEILGLWKARPLAGMADVAFWSAFWGNMGWALLLLALLYAAAVTMLLVLFRKQFASGSLFAVFAALLPLAMEGSYWVSASSRILCGLFFSAASALCYQRFLEHGKPLSMLAAAVLQVLCCGFYEQAMVFSVTLNVLLALLHREVPLRRRLWSLWGPAAGALYLLFTSLQPESALYGSRGSFSIWDKTYFQSTLPSVLAQFRQVWLGANGKLVLRGFLRGAKLVWEDRLFLPLAALLLLSAGLFFLAKGETEKPRRPLAALITGALLFLAPMSIFLVIGDSWYSLRCALFSLPGAALMADAVLRLLFRSSRLRAAITALLTFCFGLAAFSELHDYRLSSISDAAFSEQIAPYFAELTDEDTVALLGAPESWLPEQNVQYHEHILGIASSEWALRGSMRAATGRYDVAKVALLSAGDAVSSAVDYACILYYNADAQTLDLLTWEETETGDLLFFREDGTRCAETENGILSVLNTEIS